MANTKKTKAVVSSQKTTSSYFDKFFQKDGRIFLTKPRNMFDLPDLLSLQRTGYESFIHYYIHKLFEDVNPIYDIGGDKLYIQISDIKISDSPHWIEDCKRKEMTYGGVISAKVKLVELQETDEDTKKDGKKDKKPKEKVLFAKRANIGTMPLMTPYASYIVNGIERVIISQIVRSYGIFYNKWDFNYWFKVIPEKGPWLETIIEKSWVIAARIDKSRKFPITSLLRIFGAETDESIRSLFADTIDEEDVKYLDITLKKDNTTDALSAAEFIYNKLRPWEIIDSESALDYIKTLFLDPNRIFMGKIARRKVNAKLGLSKDPKQESSNLLDGDDIVASIKYLLNLANHKKGYYVDDADHLSNKRVRAMGEILYSHLSPIMRRFAKSVRGKLSVLNTEWPIKITDLVNFKIIDNSIKSFFATSQLSQFLDQTNPLSEVEHKRRITALGPGGLKRETAKFEVRDVHPSHYGRICPIQTPEGQNIGLVTYKALYSIVNEEGFLQTPALKIHQEAEPKAEILENRIAHRDIVELDIKGNPTKKIITKEDAYITPEQAKKIEKMYGKSKTLIRVKPYFSTEIEYISPEMDEKTFVADATTPVDEHNNLTTTRTTARHYDEVLTLHVKDLTHIDINAVQLFSANTSLIPFVANNDAVRASMGTNQHRQGVNLLKSDAPLVGTGLEGEVIAHTHSVVKAEDNGEIVYVDGKRVKVKYAAGIKEYELVTFRRSNHKTCINQIPTVSLGQKVKKWDLLAEGPCADGGELALGKNLKVAFMPWKGYNYEDAIVISERLVKDDELTSIQIEEYEIEVSDTKLGPEETTNDIPWVAMNKLKNLDEEWIIRIGSIVKGGDILIGKITPKGAGDLTPEEKLIQAIFGDKSKSVKDTSLYMPSGSEGKVLNVVILDVKNGDNLMAGVRKKIKVYVATTRKIEIGDKLAGKHGNKGIVSIVVPDEDMPFDRYWQRVDVVLNPLGVISRMNLGQLFEAQLGMIAKKFGVRFAAPSFTQFWHEELKDMVKELWVEKDLKVDLYDGQTWEIYQQEVTVGYMHLLKLIHMVEDKIHARSVGPYSLITQQPLGGKSRQGGQRFGEMEVRALEAYSAVYTLQEMLTVKSDDVVGRNKMYESIIKWEDIHIWGLPESFNLVTHLFKGLCQNVQVLDYNTIEDIHFQRIEKIKELGLSKIVKTKVDDSDILDDNDNPEIEEEEKDEMMDTIIQNMDEFNSDD